MTSISELKAGQGNVNIEVIVKSIEEEKSFNKFGRQLRVANAIVTDGNAEIKLTLWNDDIGKVKIGSVIKVTNGYVNEFNGEKQLTSGKFGKLEFVGEKEVPESQKNESDNKSEVDEDDELEDEEEMTGKSSKKEPKKKIKEEAYEADLEKEEDVDDEKDLGESEEDY